MKREYMIQAAPPPPGFMMANPPGAQPYEPPLGSMFAPRQHPGYGAAFARFGPPLPMLMEGAPVSAVRGGLAPPPPQRSPTGVSSPTSSSVLVHTYFPTSPPARLTSVSFVSVLLLTPCPFISYRALQRPTPRREERHTLILCTAPGVCSTMLSSCMARAASGTLKLCKLKPCDSYRYSI